MSAPAVDEPRQGLERLAAQLSARYTSIGELAYDVLRTAIDTGVFQPGQWLRQEWLAEQLGVSRIPIRSALIQLDSEGLIVFHPRRGAQVRVLTIEQVKEAYELRALLESHALRKSMAAMTAERLSRLTELADRLDQVEEGPQFIDARVAFYRELYDAARNPMLVKLIEDVRGPIGRYLLGKRMADPDADVHRQLVGTVAAGDVDGAVRTLVAHIDLVCSGVEQAITPE
ncbi:MAG: GntR family transcriptional regulator [Streptosporangiaceae bacterium]